MGFGPIQFFMEGKEWPKRVLASGFFRWHQKYRLSSTGENVKNGESRCSFDMMVYLDGPMEVIVTIVSKLGYFTYLRDVNNLVI